MESNFFSDASRVTIAGVQLIAGIAFAFYSAREKPIDHAKITCSEQVFNRISPAIKDEVTIELLIDSNYEVLFVGQITRIEGLELIVKDDMIKIKQTQITGTYLNVLPEEFVKFILNEAGISTFKIAESLTPPRERVVVRKKDGAFLLSEINRLYDLDFVSYFDTGTFYWGQDIEQTQIYKYSYGENIIDCKIERDEYKILTVPQGIVKHSHKIKVEHPQIATKTFKVDRVVYTRNIKGFLRMEIVFSQEAA